MQLALYLWIGQSDSVARAECKAIIYKGLYIWTAVAGFGAGYGKTSCTRSLTDKQLSVRAILFATTVRTGIDGHA